MYDPDFYTFRVTLYNNLQGDELVQRLTVEVLSTERLDWTALAPTIARELVEIGIAQSIDALDLIVADQSPSSFPIPLVSIAGSTRSQIESVYAAINNVVLIGKAVGNSFFMREVFLQAYNKLGVLMQCPTGSAQRKTAKACASVSFPQR